MSSAPKTIRVTAPSRLHFGLFSLPGEEGQPTHWPELDGHATVPARHFGGVGLMIDRPGVELSVAPADCWDATGPQAVRAWEYARKFCSTVRIQHAFRVTVHRCAPEHVGLGTGTQLGLAVARAIAESAVRGRLTSTDLAWAVERGRRSAIGIHGFAQGGFLVEGGKPPGAEPPYHVSPLLCLAPFPADWRVLLVVPTGLRGEYGPREVQAFDRLAAVAPDAGQTDAMCRLVLLGLLPALAEGDIDTFGEALYDFNRRAGEWFRPWQGGTYSHPRVDRLVNVLRGLGAKGVGQSSWGPAVFAVVPTEGQADDLRDRLVREGEAREDEMVITRKSEGAAWEAAPK